MNRKHLAGIGTALLMLSTSPAALAATDEEFLKSAIGINLAEIEAGEMAQQKGESDGVKEFGRMLVDDHTKANEEANRLATAANITAPSEPSEEAQKESQRLSGLSGSEFDREFVNHMVQGHEEAIALFEDKADDGSNEVSTFAKNTLPDLEKHLQTAQSLTQEQGIASAPGAGGAAGAAAGGAAGAGAMAGAAPSAGAPNASDQTGAAVSPTTPNTGTTGSMAQNEPSGGTTATPPAAGTTARPEGLRPVDMASISSDTLVGATVYGANDETVGEVRELLLSENGQSGKVDAVVIDVGGFLGIGEKPVALDFGALQIMADNNNNYYVYSKFTREQLEGATEYDPATFQQNRDRMLLRSTG